MFHDSEARIRAFITGIGAGKTMAGANEIIKFAIQHPHSFALVIGPTYGVLKVALREIERFLPRQVIARTKYSDREIHLKNNSIIEWKSAEDPETLRGTGPDIIWVDECALLTAKAWDIIYSRATREKRAYIILTTTPKGQSWLYKKVIKRWEEKDPNYDVIHCRTLDNPYCDPSVIAEAKVTAERSRQIPWFQQEYDGIFLKEGGLFYYNFDPHHVLDFYKPEIGEEIIVGIDIGLAAPTAGIWLAFKDNVFIAFAEYYRAGEIISNSAALITAESKDYNMVNAFIDPSVVKRSEITGTSLIDEFSYGLYPIPANNDWLLADKKINDLFGRDRLFVTQACPHLIQDLEDCSRDPATGKPLNKRKYHAADAFRYGVVSQVMWNPPVEGKPKVNPHQWIEDHRRKRYQSILEERDFVREMLI
jgi:hypothetical protein